MDYYTEIKNELIENEITKKAKDYSKNKSDLMHYYNVGKLLTDAGKHYGEGILREYSNKLTRDLNSKYDISTLNRMRKFYGLIEKMATMSPNLSYSHYVELLPFDNINKIQYYIRITEEQKLSVRTLRIKIKSNEFERLPDETKNKLINKQKTDVTDLIKNPLIIKNNLNIEVISEKYLKKIILEDVESFMKELGNGYSFIGSEYKIKIGNSYNYIDLLLFNYKYNCFVVIELKITELKKEHIGQIEIYMNYIDKHVKEIHHDKTIGIIICKHYNKLIMEYCSDSRIISREFKLV